MSRNRILAGCGVALVALMVLAACSPGTHEEQVAKLRARYDARVNSFFVKAEPVFAEEVMEAVEGEEAEAVEAAAEGEAVEEEPAEVEMIQNAHIDLIVQHDANEMLPGITIEIFMVDSSEQEKGRWQVWVDTSTLPKANQLQIDHVLEDIPYVEGDGFAAEVRIPVPVEERANYKEFTPQP